MKQLFNDKFKKIWHITLRVICYLIMLLYFPICMSFVSDEKAQLRCNNIDAEVNNNSGSTILITNEGLADMVERNFPDIKEMKFNEMNLHEMESIIEQSEVVKRCDMYTTPGGTLHVEISQREPIMRVFSASSSYYMDEEAFRIKARTDMHAHTIVVNGNVGGLLEAEDLITLCKYINDDNFWKAQLEQIYVTDKLEYILIPRIGDHIIEFGGIDNLDDKFNRLKALYTQGWDPQEWNLYKKVNLKYKGQIVCTKR